MRVGILTYHNEINYGSTLQAYAMQSAYEDLGVEAKIIDRYIVPDNHLLLESFAQKGIKARIKDLWYCLYGVGRFSKIIRVIKTLRFHKRYLNKTNYSFYDWKDAPKDLGVDFISVGSDQIWNANLYSPIPYLLKDSPASLPGIAYAASIGMPEIPSDYLEEYRAGFKRFRAISVREHEAVRLIESIGGRAAHVVDPTLLVNKSLWEKFVCREPPVRKRLVCYVIAEDICKTLTKLESFARDFKCDVILLCDRFERLFPRTYKGFCDFLRLRWRLATTPVRVYLSAGIEDFLREISSATWIVANSYHALMFAIIFNKDIRIIVPHDSVRKGMHARMREFAESIVTGPLMQDTLDGALLSLSGGNQIVINAERLQNEVAESREWLRKTVAEI